MAAALVLIVLGASLGLAAGEPWPRHVIDHHSKGADGVRLADANQDGWPDLVTGWEEGGVVRLCLNPGPKRVHGLWPSVTVGPARAVEDAVLADLDGDGHWDVVSACEGQEQALQVHWGPTSPDRLLQADAWRTQALPSSRGVTRWMFTLPLNIDNRFGLDLLAGSKDPNGVIGWFRAASAPRSLEEWIWHPLRSAGWIMSMIGTDMDGDGDVDLLFSDRKGQRSGCYWLERPGNPGQPWAEHAIGGAGQEVMFVTQGDLNQDGLMDVVAAVKPRTLLMCLRLDASGRAWRNQMLTWSDSAGTAKAIAIGDLTGDGRPEMVCTCEGAAQRSGVFWLEVSEGEGPVLYDISGPVGTKFDMVELLDLDTDGDLDVLTCEETENLGIVWYENR